MNDAVLSVIGVRKEYAVGSGKTHGTLKALGGIDLNLNRGEILALVGESGSGKSTLAKILVGSLSATAGNVHVDSTPVTTNRDRATSRRIQMVFQDPYSSLNPRITVGGMLAELLKFHRVVPRNQIRAESIRLLNVVGLNEDALTAYPSQFSGGQRQRLAIARALAPRPEILIADEPVSALDVSVQATILELFSQLQRDLGISILFIAHNLSVVQHLSQRIAVMYLGRIVEVAETRELFANPKHPYTRALIDSIPRMSAGAVNDAFEVDGEPPSPINLPSGCRFSPRCKLATPACRSIDPALTAVGPNHAAACIKADQLEPYVFASRTTAATNGTPTTNTPTKEALR
ncbi:dipeptide ABC transporter ATP-binding protein [Gryllotalpicola kribbensis]|uniref:Dipeptide ABC transporter ATP-binding protein n=1 Tax=Gryllotalpicola kribbensis TaxID=993084 RepID=A0ABP8AF01_9MICO